LKACLRTNEVDAAALNDRIAELENKLAELQDKLKSGVVVSSPVVSNDKQSAPTTAPKATPVQATLTPTGRNASDTWKEAMNILKKEAPSPYAMLTLGKFHSCEGNLFRWEAPAGQDFYIIALNKESNRSVIAKALSTACGVESHFEACKAGSTVTQSEQQAEDQFMREIADAFGAANVSIQEETRNG